MSHELEYEYGESVRPPEEIVIEEVKDEDFEVKLPKDETIIPIEEVIVELPKEETTQAVLYEAPKELPQTGSPLILIGVTILIMGLLIIRGYYNTIQKILK